MTKDRMPTDRTTKDRMPTDRTTTDRVETERLILRPIPLDEARRIVDGTPDATDAWADGFPREDDADGLRMLLRTKNHETPEFGSLLITDRATGLAIGSIGFYGPPDEDGHVTIGYGLVEQHRGQGLGTEALLAMVDYCRTKSGVSVILADTDLDNKASQRVLEKAGFTHARDDGELRYYRLTL